MSLGGQSNIYAAQGGIPSIFNKLAAGDTSGGIPVDNSKYAQIMELMRRRNAVNNSTYTGGFNPYVVAAPTSASTYNELARLQALADANRRSGPQGGSELGQTGFDGYGRNSSPLSSPMKGSFGYQALDAYGNLLGGMLPFGLLAQTIAQSMNPSQVEEAGKLSAQAMKDAITGYTSGEMFGAPPSDPSTFAGGGYGISVADGGYGKTSATGAGIAANPMSRDPQQAAQDIANANAVASVAQAVKDAAIVDAAEAFGVALGPAATGDVGGYGISVADGGYGKTSATGAGIAANPMGRDPQQAAQDIANANAVASAAQAMKDAITGYTSGEMFGAPPSDPSTFAGSGYGISVDDGGYGKTSATGAGIAANPMSRDPATAQGQQAYSGGPESGGGGTGVGGGDTGVGDGRDSSHGDPSGDSGGFYKGGKVTMNRLQGPNPMGPDDGYGALKDGEFVINAKSVGKYGIELMNAINAGKISKGKLRGLLEA